MLAADRSANQWVLKSFLEEESRKISLVIQTFADYSQMLNRLRSKEF